MTLAARLREWRGLARSLRVYRLDRDHARRMDALYTRFVKPGVLCFDIGAHVGDRVASFRRLGARVVACEPQAGPMRMLRLLHGLDRSVTLVPLAVGAREGTLSFRINSANPTVSTASDAFVKAADGAGGWEGQVWDRVETVEATTLDALVARHGVPAFVKIDVEGFEADVLAGLTRPLPALSFEFTTIQRGVALACIDRLAAIGPYRFDLSLGETQTLLYPEGLTAGAMKQAITALPDNANSGDVYAVLAP